MNESIGYFITAHTQPRLWSYLFLPFQTWGPIQAWWPWASLFPPSLDPGLARRCQALLQALGVLLPSTLAITGQGRSRVRR